MQELKFDKFSPKMQVFFRSISARNHSQRMIDPVKFYIKIYEHFISDFKSESQNKINISQRDKLLLH